MTELKITAMDLKSVYKQLPLSPADYNKAALSVWSSKDCDVACFECRVLPFGASASVYNFLRVSAFLRAAGSSLGILWAGYFDDSYAISPVARWSDSRLCKVHDDFLWICPFRQKAYVLPQ